MLKYGAIAVVVVVVLFLLAAKFLPAGEQIAPPLSDHPLWRLPADEQITAEQIQAVRLPVALRGYRFAEVDQLLDVVSAQVRERDEEIARLKGVRAAPDA